MKVYYGHCQAIYGSPQDKRDVDTLVRMGFDVVNPSDPEHVAMAEKMKRCGQGERVMDYFVSLVEECDAVAFGLCRMGRYRQEWRRRLRGPWDRESR
jgi:hypothetical protein